MKSTIFIPLHEDSPAGKERHISHNDKRAMSVRKMKYWGSLELGQEGIEGRLSCRIPGPRLVLLC